MQLKKQQRRLFNRSRQATRLTIIAYAFNDYRKELMIKELSLYDGIKFFDVDKAIKTLINLRYNSIYGILRNEVENYAIEETS